MNNSLYAFVDEDLTPGKIATEKIIEVAKPKKMSKNKIPTKKETQRSLSAAIEPILPSFKEVEDKHDVEFKKQNLPILRQRCIDALSNKEVKALEETKNKWINACNDAMSFDKLYKDMTWLTMGGYEQSVAAYEKKYGVKL